MDQEKPGSFTTEEVRKWWDDNAKGAPDLAGVLPIFGEEKCAHLYRQEAEWNHFLRIALLHDKMRVLELGCGAGRWSVSIARRVAEVVAVDFSGEMIKLARERATHAGVCNIAFVVSPAQSFSEPGNFDLTYFSGVDQYLDDEALAETLVHVAKMMQPGGLLVDRVTLSTAARHHVLMDNGYQCLYRSYAELLALFSRAGFKPLYRAPTYSRMRPAFLQRVPAIARLLELSFERSPRLSSIVIGSMSKVFAAFRAEPTPARSHDFVTFRLLQPR